MRWRVVCGLRVTMASFSPTSAFSSVDLPALGRPMMETGRFPMLAVHMIQVGEETGRLDDMLLQVAETYDREVEVAIRKSLALLQPVMIIAMALIIGFIIAAILSAMLSIYDIPI